MIEPVAGKPGPLAAGDIDDDGFADAFVLLPERGAVQVIRTAVGYTMRVAETYPVGRRGGTLFDTAIVAPDLHGDGQADLVLVGPGGAWTIAGECRE